MTPHTHLNNNEALKAFDRLLVIMDELRRKCPWDQQQTMESLRHLTIEETFELSEAILEGEVTDIKKELGDLLLHIVFYAHIAAEKQDFTIKDVIQALCEKLVYRHPHIYGQEKAEDANTVKQNWEKLKLKEKDNPSVLGGVPRALPSLIKAMRIQEKASLAGFDWQEKEAVWQQIQELMHVVNQDVNDPTQQTNAQEAFGDLLFALISYARLIEVNSEEALAGANKKFMQRFQHVEKQIVREGKQITQLSSEELLGYWQQAVSSS